MVALGKVLDDDEKTMTDYNVVDNHTIVVMVIKPKPVKPVQVVEEVK